MKVYLAGFKTVEKLWDKPTEDIYLLSSFIEHRGKHKGRYISQKNHILDSGAFTYLNGKKTGNIDWDKYINEYANFINQYKIDLFFELDIDPIIGLKEVEKLRVKLETLTNKQCIPVWHKSRGLDYWKKMVKEYKYVAIGGIVTKEIKRNQYDIFSLLLKIAKNNNCKVHALGFTNLKNLKKYKFYSVDSTSWIYGNKLGYVDRFVRGKLERIDKPMGTRLVANKVLIHNFKEWVKFQKYADENL